MFALNGSVDVPNKDAQVWRIHIRPAADPAIAFQVCMNQGALGVGWQVDRPAESRLDLDTYLKLAQKAHPDTWSSCKSAMTALSNMAEGDLVWTRDTFGIYWLGRIEGPWEYRDHPENRKADIVNVRPVRLERVGTIADVPGKVVASMRSSRTVQRVNGDTVRLYSQYAFAELTGESLPRAEGLDIFQLMSDQDCEDVIFVLLQRRGWVVFPARRLTDTMSYEYALRSSKDGTDAVAQVKTGYSPIEFDSLPRNIRVFAFQSNRLFHGLQPENVEIIEPAEVKQFMRANLKILPPAVNRWIDIAGLATYERSEV